MGRRECKSLHQSKLLDQHKANNPDHVAIDELTCHVSKTLIINNKKTFKQEGSSWRTTGKTTTVQAHSRWFTRRPFQGGSVAWAYVGPTSCQTHDDKRIYRLNPHHIKQTTIGLASVPRLLFSRSLVFVFGLEQGYLQRTEQYLCAEMPQDLRYGFDHPIVYICLGGSPIQRVEEDKKESNEVVLRVNKSEASNVGVYKLSPGFGLPYPILTLFYFISLKPSHLTLILPSTTFVGALTSSRATNSTFYIFHHFN
ncbi:hypothetical protein VNO80_19718 [Phaseolus coccineus]|uniref:Uncharacterized protein n=1 Tax=Phaseolus coccineus TaxID=3886 RepID=A0AAN9R0Z3_PHACN